MTARRKLLVAIRPQDRDLVLAALGSEFELHICYTSTEALEALRSQDIGLIICGVHFDEGRMFELLGEAKADPATRDIPFIPVMGETGSQTEGIRQGIRSAALSLGAANFIDMPDLLARHGTTETFNRLRKMARDALR